MVPHSGPRDFLHQKFSFWLLGVVLTWCFSVIGATAPIQLKGELGGEVAFRCPVKNQHIKFLYLQRGLSFVNGFYESRDPPNKWENTWMDRDNMTVHMHSLNISHEGKYDCKISYSNGHDSDETVIQLNVTANFSKPEVTVLRMEKLYWIVTCSSHAGYPASNMSWNASRKEMLKVVNSSEVTNPITLTINSSSTALFNCSMGEVKFTCSVGGVTSTLSFACTPRDSPFSYYIVIAAAAVCATCFIIAVVCYWQKCKKRGEGAAAQAAPGDVRQEWVNGNAEQHMALVEGL